MSQWRSRARSDRCSHGLLPEQCDYCRQDSAPKRDGRAGETNRWSTLSSPTPLDSSSWQKARDLSREQRFSKGDRVRLIADPQRQGVVTDVVDTGLGFNYSVFFSIDEITTYAEEKLDRVVTQPRQGFQSQREFLRDLLLIKLRERLSDNLYSYQASRTLFYVYQFRPALRFLNSPEQRILIADEVGLGKTIEAGLIYLELKARFELRRVLVVCPSVLRAKWRDEMRSRFDEEFRILESRDLQRFLDDYDRLGDAVELRGICSLELLRRGEFATRVADLGVTFQLVIIDEAHHLRNTDTLSHAIGEVLADQSDALVLLTATPLQTGNEDLFHLMQLVDPGEFASFDEFEERIAPNKHVNRASQLVSQGEFHQALQEIKLVEHTVLGRRFLENPYYREVIGLLRSRSRFSDGDVVGLQRRLLELNTLSHVFNRTRKREFSDAAQRRASTLEVNFSEVERAFYEAVIEFVCRQMGQIQTTLDAPIFSLIMRERQAASSIQALKHYFEEELLTQQLALGLEDGDPDLETGELKYRNFAIAHSRLRHLLSLCSALGDTDSKFDTFVDALRSVLNENSDAKILVFSFFRGTLDYLTRRLETLGYRVRVIHGGVNLDVRIRHINEFKEDPNIHILLSSEVGAEGLDFQFCGTMFNYDLPWNPMRVEQRIGRLDRFGQAHPVIQIYNLVIADTVETRIFARLYDRIRIFESSIGDLEAILGSVIRELSRKLFLARLTPEEEIRRAEEAARRIERERLEQEEFEKQRMVLLGQDQIFEQELESIRDSGRYVSPDEVRSLLECFLTEAFPEIRLEPNDGDPTDLLRVDDTFRQGVSRMINQIQMPKAISQAFLRRLHSKEWQIPLTFDAETARQRKLVEFITIHHPLAIVAAAFFLKQRSVSAPVTSLVLPGGLDLQGEFAFFIYRLKITCLTPESTLVPILVDRRPGRNEPLIATRLLADLQHLQIKETHSESITPADLDMYRPIADQRISTFIQEREHEVRGRNDALIAARLASVEQSFAFRIENARRQIRIVSDQRIIRMRQSQIKNLESDLDQKKMKIGEGRNVVVGHELVASGVVTYLRAHSVSAAG